MDKLKIIQIAGNNKDNIFIEVDSPSWRIPNKISLSNLIAEIKFDKISLQIDNETLIIDPDTLKIQINNACVNTNVVFVNQDISIYANPISYPDASGMYLSMDDNYLYVWHEKQKKWKRIPLLDID
jgi:hypothetical protein